MEYSREANKTTLDDMSRIELEQMMKKMIEGYGWRLSEARADIMVVIHGSPQRVPQELRWQFNDFPLKDHGRLYMRNGPQGRDYMYLTQPYAPIESKLLKQLMAFCEEHDLEFVRFPFGPWNPPRCLALFITKRGVSFRRGTVSPWVGHLCLSKNVAKCLAYRRRRAGERSLPRGFTWLSTTHYNSSSGA